MKNQKLKEILIPFLLATLLTVGGVFYKPKYIQNFLHPGRYFECWYGGTFRGVFYICNQYPPSENTHYYFLATVLLINFLIFFILYQGVKWIKRK